MEWIDIDGHPLICDLSMIKVPAWNIIWVMTWEFMGVGEGFM